MTSPAQDRLRPLYEKAGAHWVELPVLHPADPFLETAGEDIRRRMFVTEGPQGERLALRPDFTIPLCLEHLRSADGAARYAYEGLVFRRHEAGAPERLETGYEDIGRPDRAKADAEVLALAVACAAEVTDKPLTVRLGDIGVFTAVLRALGLPGRWRRRLRRSFGLPQALSANLQRMAAPPQAETERLDPALARLVEAGKHDELIGLIDERRRAHGHGEGAGRTSAEIAERLLESRALSDAAAAAHTVDVLNRYMALEAPFTEAEARLSAFAETQGLDLGAALEAFAERAATIAAAAPAAPIRFEAGFGRPLDYYTGLVFEVRAENIREPLAGGGRYDRLMEMLGAESAIPAVGFTMGLDVLDAGPKP